MPSGVKGRIYNLHKKPLGKVIILRKQTFTEGRLFLKFSLQGGGAGGRGGLVWIHSQHYNTLFES